MSPEVRMTQIEFIINMYKDTHGVKPHHIDFDTLSDVELDQMADTVAEDHQACNYDVETEEDLAYWEADDELDETEGEWI